MGGLKPFVNTDNKLWFLPAHSQNPDEFSNTLSFVC